ncbi:MAG: transcription elongation factor GreA [Proteobacteria bacterium]|nr:transcription elongation factor GreA [Pseudomonadota bacterium]
MVERVLLTPVGETRLRAELKRLKSSDRPKVIAAIAEARAHGDLSENAEYHAAREQQSFIEGRIKELESKLSIAEVIDASKSSVEGKVIFGAYVTLYDLNSEQEVTYQIVGDLEADLENGKITVSSPLARALIGKEIDDEVTFKAPAGVKEFEIVDVKYA